jgi:hypothetical protein
MKILLDSIALERSNTKACRAIATQELSRCKNSTSDKKNKCKNRKDLLKNFTFVNYCK